MNIPRTTELVFLLPPSFRGIGGVERILVSIAQSIAAGERPTVTVRALVPRESYTYAELSSLGAGVRVDTYDQGPIVVREDSLLVVWGGYGLLKRWVKGSPRIHVWSIYPGSPLLHLAGRRLLEVLVKPVRERVAQGLAAACAIGFMDEPNRVEFARLAGFVPRDDFVPVPIAIRPNGYIARRRRSIGQGPFTISYVGRGKVIWKVAPLIAFLKECIRTAHPVRLNLYTDDPTEFRALLSVVKLPYELELSVHVGMSGTELQNALMLGSDVHVGMGTAVLEGASVGVPSICLDPQQSISDLPSWTWLPERQNFSLGDFHAERVEIRKLDLEMMASDAERRSAECHAYVAMNHDVEQVVQRLVMSNSSMTLSRYLALHGRPMAAWAGLNAAVQCVRARVKGAG